MFHYNGSRIQIDHARKAGLSTREMYSSLQGLRPEVTRPGGQPIDSNGFIAQVHLDGRVSYESSGQTPRN